MNKTNKTKRVSLMLDEPTYNRLKKVAEIEKRSLNAQLTYIINGGFNKFNQYKLIAEDAINV